MGRSLIAPWEKPEGLEQIRTWRAQGLTMEQTAREMKVGGRTLRRWALEHPRIREALRTQKSIPSPPPTPSGKARPVPQGKPRISIEIAPPQDLYPFARAAGLTPLSPEADPKLLERLVESALLRRALGCRYATVTSELRKDPVTGEMVMTVTKRVDKDVPPDTSAQLFWLKTHDPERWRDKAGDEPAGDGEVLVTFDVDEEEDEPDWEDEE